MKNTNLRYTIILTIGNRVVVKHAYNLEKAKDWAATADHATIIDTWKNKIKG